MRVTLADSRCGLDFTKSEGGDSRGGTKVYFGLGCDRPRPTDTQEIGHSDQVGQGSRLHFSHNVAAVHLHCDFADIELCGNLFV